MVSARAETDEHSVLAESGDPVTDAFLSFGRCRPNGFAKLLECGSLVLTQAVEVLVNGLGFPGHSLFPKNRYRSGELPGHLPVVAEWIDDAPDAPTVGVLDGRHECCAGGDGLFTDCGGIFHNQQHSHRATA